MLCLAVRLIFLCDVNLVLDCKYMGKVTGSVITAFELSVSCCCTVEMSDGKSGLFKLSGLTTSDKQAAYMQAALYLTWHSPDGIH